MPTEPVQVKIEMERSFRDILFRVVRKTDQTPVANAKIEILSETGAPINDYITNDRGEATCPAMPADSIFMWICNADGLQIVRGTAET